MSGPIAPSPPPNPPEAVHPSTGVALPEPGGRVGQFLGTRPIDPPKDVPWVTVARRSPVGFLFSGLFLLFVALPTALAVWYYGFTASDVYISESRFVVRSPQRAQQPGVIGALLQGSGFQRAQDDSFSVHDFMTSRDALKALDKKLQLRQAFSNESIDFLSRFPQPWMDDSFEWLFKYYGKQVQVSYDTASAITTLTVRGFSPDLALRVNTELLAMGEDLVNQINDRGRVDLVKFAEADVAEAEAKAKAAAVALASYRNRRAVFDPEKQSALQLQQVTKIQDELIAAKLQLAQIRALSPANPQIPTIERRVNGLQTEMANEMAKVAGGRGDSGTLTDKAAEFERLQLERTFAERQVASAMTNLESARSEARRKQLYLERIVQPNLPDRSLEPRRLRSIVSIFVFGLLAWGAAAMLLAGVREHRD